MYKAISEWMRNYKLSLQVLSLFGCLQGYSNYCNTEISIHCDQQQEECVEFILKEKHYYNTFYLPFNYAQMGKNFNGKGMEGNFGKIEEFFKKRLIKICLNISITENNKIISFIIQISNIVSISKNQLSSSFERNSDPCGQSVNRVALAASP